MIGFLMVWHAHQVAIGGVAPAVVGTGKNGGVARIVPADLHATVSACVQEHLELALAVPGEND